MRTRSFAVLLLALTMFLAFFWQRGLNEPDEGRYVEIAREMMVTGDLVTPRLKGVPHYAKPPLTYWSIAASMTILGINEFAARLPGLLAALMVLILVFDLGRRLGAGIDAGIISALALSAMIEFFALARIVTTDMLHCLFITMAIWAFLRAELDPLRRRRFNLLVFVALGLGFLNKGPVPIGVLLSGLLAASCFRRDLVLFRRRDWLLGLPILFAIGLPWYLVVAVSDPDLYSFFLGGEVVDRVASGRGRAKPIWYFLVVLPLGLLPLTPLVIRSVVTLFRDRAEEGDGDRAEEGDGDRAEEGDGDRAEEGDGDRAGEGDGDRAGEGDGDRAEEGDGDRAEEGDGDRAEEGDGDRAGLRRGLLLGFLVGPFLLFSLSASKLWTYILPLLPVAALVVGLDARVRISRGFLLLCSAGFILGLTADFAAEERALELGNNVSYRRVAERFDGQRFRGIPIPESITAATEVPSFSAGVETRIATYRLRFTAAAFYFLGDRREYLPIYGADSLWEWESRALTENRPGLADLVAELRKPEPMLVLLKARDLDELSRAYGAPLEIVETFGRGDKAVVACLRYR